MTMPLDPEKIEQLKNKGMIDDNVYQRAMNQNVAQADPLFAQDKNKAIAANIKQMQLDKEKAGLDKKSQALLKMGFSQDEVEAKLAPQIENLSEKERSLILTGEKEAPEGTLTSDLIAPEQPQAMDQMPAGMGAFTAAMDLQQQAVAEAGRAGMLKAEEQTAQMRQTQAKLDEMRKQNEFEAYSEQVALEDEQAKLNEEVQRVSELKIDQGRFWNNKSTGEKIGLGISLFLGALGGASTGVNQAAKMINAAIDRDINAQQADIAQQTRGLDRKRGIFADMKSRFKDQRMARDATRIAYLNDAQMKIQEIASRYEGLEAQSRAKQLIGQIEMEKQKYNVSFMQQFAKNRPFDPNTPPEK